jgi:hypothetical protein
VLVPQGADPYSAIKAIQEVVTRETSADAREAELEWQSHALQSFSAASDINLKPTSLGVEIIVRYIARAHKRYDLRGRLNASIVELLHVRSPQQPPPVSQETGKAGYA